MAKNKVFIVASDGQYAVTALSAGILARARQLGLSTVAIKPVATGCKPSEQGLRSEQALALIAQMSLALPYAQVNPVALALDREPMLAAAAEGRRLSASQLLGISRGVLMQAADLALVEATGGWREPLNTRESQALLARELALPVVMVVTTEPGCLNRALLTMEAIARDGVTVVAWIACALPARGAEHSEEQRQHHNYVAALRTMLRAPCIADVGPAVARDAQSLAAIIDLTFVISSQN
jgi:dethiobiotin synthetase